jgi:hypothetical protein
LRQREALKEELRTAQLELHALLHPPVSGANPTISTTTAASSAASITNTTSPVTGSGGALACPVTISSTTTGGGGGVDGAAVAPPHTLPTPHLQQAQSPLDLTTPTPPQHKEPQQKGCEEHLAQAVVVGATPGSATAAAAVCTPGVGQLGVPGPAQPAASGGSDGVSSGARRRGLQLHFGGGGAGRHATTTTAQQQQRVAEAAGAAGVYIPSASQLSAASNGGSFLTASSTGLSLRGSPAEVSSRAAPIDLTGDSDDE